MAKINQDWFKERLAELKISQLECSGFSRSDTRENP